MKLKELKQQFIEILSDPRVAQKVKGKPIKLIPFCLNAEYTCHWLHVGYVAPEKYHPEEDVICADPEDAKHLSFFTLPDFGSLSLNRILFMAGGIDRHAEDPVGTTAKIEKQLAKQIGMHMTVESLRHGDHDETLRYHSRNGFETGTSGSHETFRVTTMTAEDGLRKMKKVLAL